MKRILFICLMVIATASSAQSYPWPSGATLTSASLNAAFLARTTYSSGALPKYMVLLGNGFGDIAGIGSYGTAGQFLVSGGNGLSPSWITGGIYNPAAVAITGGTINGTTAISALSVSATTPILSASQAGAISYGLLSYTDTNLVASYSASVNNYVQHVVENSYCGTLASADYVVSNNLGTASTYYANFGINSSCFTGAGSLNLPSASYMAATSGDMVIGTTTANIIHFLTNSATTDAAQISAANVLDLFDNTFAIENTTDPTKRAIFSLSGFPTATTYTYTLPSSSGTIASLNTTQIFTTAQTFNGGMSVVGTSTLNGPTNNIGTGTIGGTQSIGASATGSGNTQNINIGNGGVSGSTTNINLGGTYGSSVIVGGSESVSGQRTFSVPDNVIAAIPTIVSATMIAPTTPIAFVSGTTTVVTITVPSGCTHGCQVTIIPTGIFATTTAGNISIISTMTVDRANIFTYDATSAKWYPSY